MSGHVLVIEDNADNQKLVIRYLSAKGYRVVAASTAHEADVAFGAEQPGLVLVDVSLPGEDGLTWVRRTRADRASQIPMVAVTAHAMPEDRERALAAGCTDYMAKPIALKALLALTERYLGAPGVAA